MPPTPEHALVLTVQAASTRELARNDVGSELREMLADMSVGLNMAMAAQSPKLYQVRRQLGEGTVIKLLVVILKAFVDSLKVPSKPDAADIIEIADALAQKYTHDSLKDVVLALKEARTNGTKFYQAVDASVIHRVINEYFDRKAQWTENWHRDFQAHTASAQSVAVKQLGDTSAKMLENVAQQIPSDHPNAEGLRQKLTITNGKARRGLITPEQAQQQRADLRKVTTRKARPDWKPSPEAQRQMERKHENENREIMQRYRVA
ncbi:hypothetical protein ACVWYF_004167 [Hymenobacter sp. UYAg731]